MSEKPGVDLVFLWHMHQPDYRDRARKKFILPWARLHALKDYLDMPCRLLAHEGIHQTFNLVPSLVDQLECYLTDEWEEDELRLFRKRAEDLTEQERSGILGSFFMAPEEWMIRPYPRYAGLLKDYHLRSETDLAHRWSPQEWRDLQVWRQLSWFDPEFRDRDPILVSLVQQGQNFEESHKDILLERMKDWISRTLQAYRDLQDQGVIEVSITPYYHPILPLLIDPASVNEAMPDCPLPEQHGGHPEDARIHLQKAIEFYEKRFGHLPRGMWPSEGSVSQAFFELIQGMPFEWVATDEDILAASLKLKARSTGEPDRLDAERLYRPYASLDGKGPAIIFRDHRLSDLIGFDYSRWDPKEAAVNFVSEIVAIEKEWKGKEAPIVSVILDGENCWEHFERDGAPFLSALYSELLSQPGIRCRTVSEAIAGRSREPLKHVSAGSWIHGNFYIWMGEDEDRRAWALLEQTRRELVEVEALGEVPQAILQEAWEEIFIAEGSDWFWWFGTSQNSDQDSLFDEMFRMHLIRVYDLLGRSVPEELRLPVETRSRERVASLDTFLISSPSIEGLETHYYEWRGAARYLPELHGGAMRPASQTNVAALYYGADAEALYLRIDLGIGLGDRPVSFDLRVTNPKPMTIRFSPQSAGYRIERRYVSNGAMAESAPVWREVKGKSLQAARDTIFEASVPWSLLESTEGDTLSFFLAASTDSNEWEILPPLSSLSVLTPGSDRPGRQWFP